MSSSKLYDEIGMFATIPETIIKLIPTIGANAYTLWTYLRWRTNSRTGDAFPSYETIRDDMGNEFHFKEVARCLRVLEENGLVSRKKRFGQSSIYTLMVPPPPSKTETHSPLPVERNEGEHSPLPVESTVLYPLKAQSFQRVKTNQIEVPDRNNQIENTARGAEPPGEEQTPSETPTGENAPDTPAETPPEINSPPAGYLKVRAARAAKVSAPDPLAPELPAEQYLFQKVNEERARNRYGPQKRFKTLAQKQEFRLSIQFFNGSTSAEIDKQLALGRGQVDSIVNAINWRRKNWDMLQRQAGARGGQKPVSPNARIVEERKAWTIEEYEKARAAMAAAEVDE